MLCQFTVKNFKSIRDEVTFDMQAAAISEHEDRIIKDVDEELYLPVSAVYGPNGGGKSNVLEALHSLVTKVLRPLYATSNNEEIAMKMKKLVIEPFAFDEGTRNEPTEFELFFRTEMAEYRYELTVKKEVIEYERLDRIKLETGRRSALFERDEDEITLKGAFAKLKTSDELSDTLPLLSYLGITYSKNEVVQDVLDWFDEEIDFLNYGNPMQELRMAVSKSEDVKRLMLQMIQEMDLDIVDFRVEEKENDRIEVFTKHVVDEYEAELNLFDESSGTKKLFGLLPFIAKSLLKGTTLVIDELDAKIHPVLLKYLIMTFSNMEKNKKGAQLIFTSHDLSTMNSEVFRRDEIWFVAKGNRQNSKLYSLVEFKNKKGESVRKDAKFDKQYLEGKYGADPYLRKIIEGFKRYIEDNPIYRDMVLIEIEGCQAETMRVIGKAEEYVRENKITKGQIWCVYDKDSFPSSDVNGVVQRAEVLNQKNPDIQYHAAWSNECIEFWFMLHFAYYTANNHRSEYKKFLNEKFQELGIGKYEKNMDNIFETLMNGGNPKLAIRYAKRTIKNGEGKTPAEIAPGTKVYELVEELVKYLPEEQKKCFM